MKVKRTALPTIRASLMRAIDQVDQLKDDMSFPYRSISVLISEIEFAEACAKQLEVRHGKIVGVNNNNGNIT